MHANIIDTITAQYNNLTKSGKILANYIFANHAEVQYMSITSLADNCRISDASITRFCKGLGLSGYNDLKLALAKADHIHSSSATSGSTTKELYQQLQDAYLAAITETKNLLTDHDLNRAARILTQARQVFCFGQGGSMVMAKEAWARFSTFTTKFIHIEDVHFQTMATSLLSSKDAILFFSYSGSTKELQEIMELANEKHTPVILITHFKNSHAARNADVTLLCGYNESPLQSGCISAKIGQLFLIDCIFHEYCEMNPTEADFGSNQTIEAVSKRLL